MTTERERLEYLRGCLRAECISLGELIELQNLVPFIDPSDVELLEAAGVPEFPDEGNEDTEMPPIDWAAARGATPNGYDPAWVAAINGVLEDRDAPVRIDDLDDHLWERFIGPLVDCIEDGYAVDEYDDDGDVIPAIYRPYTPPIEFPLDKDGKPLAWPDPNEPERYVDAWNGIYDSRYSALMESIDWTAPESERRLPYGATWTTGEGES